MARVGVLALQGDFLEHIQALEILGLDALEIRLPSQLENLDGLIIPGGESTTIIKLADTYGLREAIGQFAKNGSPVWGTCAGMIILADSLTDPYPKPFGLIDITVSRNWFGRQVDSFEADLDISGVGGASFRGVFIRAPVVTRIGEDVERIAVLDDGTPVAVRSKNIIATAFHPELTDDLRLHKYFLSLT